VLPRLAFLGVLLAISAALAACGSEDKSNSSSNKTDQAFLEGMVPHHEAAIEMADVAAQSAEQPETRALAGEITRNQRGEIEQMERIHKRLFDTEIVPDPAAHERLGLSAKDAGMDHNDLSELEDAKRVDRTFIDMMVPHHQGAIRMARVVLRDTNDAEIKRLAEKIIDMQAREITDMNEWRERWYGSPSPAGGVPRETPSKPEGEGTVSGGDHDGH